MAVSAAAAKNFVIKIVVQGDAEKPLGKVRQAAHLTAQEERHLNAVLETQRMALDLARQNLELAANGYKDAAAQARMFNSVIEDGAVKVDEQVTALETLGNVLGTIVRSGSDVIRTVDSMVSVFKMLTDASMLKKLANVAYVMGLIASVKGYGTTADGLFMISDKLDGASEKAQEYKNWADESLQVVQHRVEMVKEGFGRLTTAAATLGVAFGGIAVFKLSNSFNILGKGVGNVTRDLVKMWGTFNKVDESLSAKMSPTLFRVADFLWVLSKPMAIVSALFLTAENDLIQLTGALGMTGAAFGALFGLVFSYALKAFASLSIAIGETLMESMSKFEEKFEKAQVVMRQFTFTISGFARTLGTEVVGSVERWVGVMDDLRRGTTFGSNEIAKSIKLLVAEGSRFGLTIEQVDSLVRRTGDVSAAFGEDISDTAAKVNAALAGNAQALQNMGFNVSESAFSHSELFLNLGKTREELTRAEAAAVRYDLIMHETNALVGAAADQMQTLTGANLVYDKTLTDLQVKLGAVGGITMMLVSAKTKLLTALLDLPDAIIDIVGTMQDWFGISFLVSGVLLKSFSAISFGAMVYKFLTVAVAKHITLQLAADKAFGFLNLAIGTQMKDVKSLGDVWRNLVFVMRDMLLQSFEMIILSLKTFAAGIINATMHCLRFTAALMANPLFWKGVAIAGAIFGIVKAFEALSDVAPDLIKIAFILGSIAGAIYSLNRMMETNARVQGLLTMASRVFGREVGVATVRVTSLSAAMLNAQVIMRGAMANAIAAAVPTLKAIGAGFLAAAKATLAFTASLLANPLFWKAAAIVGAVYLVYRAIKETIDALPFLNDLLDDFSDNFAALWQSGAGEASEFGAIVKQMFSELAGTATAWVKTFTGMIVNGFLVLGVAAAHTFRALRWIKNGFEESEDDAEAFKLQMDELHGRMKQVSGFIMKSGKRGGLFGDVAMAAEAMSEFEKKTAHTEGTLDKLIALNMKGFSESEERIKSYGTEFEKAMQAQKVAQESLAKIKEKNLELDEKAKDIAEAQKEAVQKRIEVDRLRLDTIKGIEEETRKLDLEEMKRAGRTVDVLRAEQKVRLEAFDKTAAGLKLLGGMTDDQISKVKSSRSVLIASFQQELKNVSATFDDIAKGVTKVSNSVETFRSIVAKMKDSFKPGELRLEVFGDEADKLFVAQSKAAREAQQAFEKANVSGTTDDTDDAAKKQQESAKATLQIAKAQIDKIKELKDVHKQATVQAFKDSEQLARAAEVEGSARLAEYDKNIALIKKLGKLSIDNQRIVDETRLAIVRQNEAAITEARVQEAEKVAERSKALAEQLLKEQEAPLSKMQEIIERYKDLVKETANIGMTDLEVVDRSYEQAVKEIDLIEEELARTQALTSERKLQLNVAREMAEVQRGKGAAAAGMSVGDIGAAWDYGVGIVDGFSGAWESAADADMQYASDLFADGISGSADLLKEGGASLIQSLRTVKLADIGAGIAEGIEQGAELFVDIISGALIDKLGGVIDFLASMPARFFEAFASLDRMLKNFLASMPRIMSALVDRLPAIIDAIIAAIPKLAQALAAIMPKVAEAFALAAPRLVEAIMQAIPVLIEAIPVMVQSLMQAIPGVIDEFMRALPKIIMALAEAIPQIMNSIFAAIPEIVVQFMENIDEVIGALVQGLIMAMGDIALGFVDAMLFKGGLEKIIGALLRAIPRIAGALVSGIWKGLMHFLGGLGKLFGGKMKAPQAVTDLPKDLSKAAKDFGKSIAKDASKIFSVKDFDEAAKGMISPKDSNLPGLLLAAFEKGKGWWEKVVEAWRALWNWIEGLWTKLTGFLKEVWMWVYTKVIEPLVSVVQKAWQWVVDKIITPLATVVAKAWQWVVDKIIMPLATVVSTAFQWVVDKIITPLATVVAVAFQWVVDKIITPLATVVSTAFQWVVDKIITPMATVVSAAWQAVFDFFKGIGGIVSDAWKTIVDFWKNIFSGKISEAFKGVLDFFTGLGDKVTKAFQPIVDFFSGVKEGFGSKITAAWSAVIDFFSNAKTGIGSKLTEAWKSIINFFSSGKEGLFKGVAAAFKPVIDLFNGLKTTVTNAFNGIGDFGTKIWESFKSGIQNGLTALMDGLNPGNLFNKLFNTDSAWGKGKVEDVLGIDVPFVKFAAGGVIPGMANVPGDSELNDRILALVSPGEAIIPRSKMNDPMIREAVASILAGTFAPPKFGYSFGQFKEDVKKLDPSKLWEQVLGRVGEGLMNMFGNNRFANGGIVGDRNVIDFAARRAQKMGTNVPKFAFGSTGVRSPGPNIARASTMGNQMTLLGSGGGVTITIQKMEFNSTAPLSKETVKRDIVPTMLEEIKQRSRNGQFIIAQNGIRGA